MYIVSVDERAQPRTKNRDLAPSAQLLAPRSFFKSGRAGQLGHCQYIYDLDIYVGYSEIRRDSADTAGYSGIQRDTAGYSRMQRDAAGYYKNILQSSVGSNLV